MYIQLIYIEGIVFAVLNLLIAYSFRGFRTWYIKQIDDNLDSMHKDNLKTVLIADGIMISLISWLGTA